MFFFEEEEIVETEKLVNVEVVKISKWDFLKNTIQKINPNVHNCSDIECNCQLLFSNLMRINCNFIKYDQIFEYAMKNNYKNNFNYEELFISILYALISFALTKYQDRLVFIEKIIYPLLNSNIELSNEIFIKLNIIKIYVEFLKVDSMLKDSKNWDSNSLIYFQKCNIALQINLNKMKTFYNVDLYFIKQNLQFNDEIQNIKELLNKLN